MLDAYPGIQNKPETVVRRLIEKITGRPFYNLSRLDFPKLLNDPDQLAQNLVSYINGFSSNVRETIERFKFEEQVHRMQEKNLLYQVVKGFSNVDLSPRRVDNVQMGYVFEELILTSQSPLLRTTRPLRLGMYCSRLRVKRLLRSESLQLT